MKITRLLFYTGLFLMLIVGVMAVSQSHAAQTPVGTITTPSTGQTTLKAYNDNYVNPKLTIIGGNFDDIAANKADKAQSIRYWADHANGTTLAVGTIVAYEGKLYNTTQEFLKTAGATPPGFSAYFSEVAGGSGGTTYTAGTGITITEGVIASTVTDTDTFASWDKDYTDLINKPTIPTISDTAYGVGWNGDAGAASKNAIYDKIETIAGGTMTYPGAGVPVSTGSAWGTSLVADGDAIGEVVVVQDDGSGNPELPFTIDISSLTDTTAILTGKLSVSAIDDSPVDSETAAPISSNYMYDHVNGADPHTGYVLESALGSGVGTMLAIAPGSVGGPTTTIASGTSALGTGAISSGACASVVTTSATGTATTDVINWGFNSSPAAVTGYVASANGMLTIIAYPSSGNVNFLVCNNTAASITPGAVTLNWRIQR